MKEEILKFYKKTSIYTNYGEYKAYFCSLPNDLIELSKLVFFQTIHRVTLRESLLSEKENPIKKEYPWYQYRLHDDILLTTPAITAELFRLDDRGFTLARECKHKVVITCRYVSILLASVLKAKGYSCRVRSGFASYFKKDVALDHWIVQVWDEEKKKWINIDAEYIGENEGKMMPENQYFFAAQAWLDVRVGKINNDYFLHGSWIKGLPMLARALFFDFHALMNDEISYLFFPTYIDEDEEFYNLSVDDLKELDELATLMLNPDENFEELSYIFRNDKKLRALNTPLMSDRDHVEL